MHRIFYKYMKYFILVLLISLPIFVNLGELPIHVWDEYRQAMNAFEMMLNKDFIVTYYEGNPDMWNTKPPLLIWLQVLFMNLIGVNELAIRLPSAFAVLFTCIIILFFSVRYLRSFWFGFIAMMVLITTEGYIGYHASRTGDYDALLTLFTTLSGLLFFLFTETKKTKYLYLFFLFTAFAVLTKGITGLLFLPALTIYTLGQKQFIILFKNKHFYVGLLSFLSLVLGYYYLREFYNPGYLLAVQENELGGRFLNKKELFDPPFYSYFLNLIHNKFFFWYPLVPLGIWVGLVQVNKKINRITLFSILMVSTYLLIITVAQTRRPWYDVPLYPFLSILAAIFIYYIFLRLRKVNWTDLNLNGFKFKQNMIPTIFLMLIYINPYQKILEKTLIIKESPQERSLNEIGYFLKDAILGKEDVDDCFLMFNSNYIDNYYLMPKGNNIQNNFYIKILESKGIMLSFKDWKKLEKGDKVLVSKNNIKNYIEKKYFYQVIKEKGNIIKYQIYGRK